MCVCMSIDMHTYLFICSFVYLRRIVDLGFADACGDMYWRTLVSIFATILTLTHSRVDRRIALSV